MSTKPELSVDPRRVGPVMFELIEHLRDKGYTVEHDPSTPPDDLEPITFEDMPWTSSKSRWDNFEKELSPGKVVFHTHVTVRQIHKFFIRFPDCQAC